jgi:tetratricopeptide (TPR) repeat protein
VGRGRAYYQKKDYAAALTDYDAAIRLVPNNPRRWRSGATQMNGPAIMIAPLKITAASSKSSPANAKARFALRPRRAARRAALSRSAPATLALATYR